MSSLPAVTGDKDRSLAAILTRLEAAHEASARAGDEDPHVTAIRRLPAVDAEYAPFPDALDPRLRQALASRQGLSAQQARIRRAVAEVERRRSAYNPSITLASDVALSPGGTLERVAGVDLDPAHEVLVQGIRAIGDRHAVDRRLARLHARVVAH